MSNIADRSNISYFNIDLNNLDKNDKNLLEIIKREKYYTNIFQSVDSSQFLSTLAKTYNFKYVPINKSIKSKYIMKNN